MINSDIRISMVMAFLIVFIAAGFFVPDRYGREWKRVTPIIGGMLLMAFLANVPAFKVWLTPLPTGPGSESNFWVMLSKAELRPGALPAIVLGLYLAAGLAWAVGHFGLYARRLGQTYVLERDCWMRARNLKSLEDLSPAARDEFQQVIDKVKGDMLYEGDFPLQPLQQKRMFVGNLLLWPATLLFYFVSDLAVDGARYVWFALRGYVQKRWESGMALYLADEALCHKRLGELGMAPAG